MEINISVNHIARVLADRVVSQLPVQQRGMSAHNRTAYNIKVTAFNAATVGAICAVAFAALFSCKIFFLAIGLALWGLRSAVQKDLHKIGEAKANREQLLEHFEAAEQVDWQPDKITFLGGVIWKNMAPKLENRDNP